MAKNPKYAEFHKAEHEILVALGDDGIRAEYERLGADLGTRKPNSGGWLAFSAIDREDKNHSAGTCLNPSDESYGGYRDLRSGRTITLFQAMAEFGPYKDFIEARAHLAGLVGVTLPNARGGKGKTAATFSEDDIEEIYPYADLSGRVIERTLRLKGKKFRKQIPDGNGGWINKGSKEPIPIFEAAEVAARPGDVVYVPEGERDVWELKKWNRLGTTVAGGAGKSCSHHADQLKGRDVVLLADNDKAGEDHVLKFASQLDGKAKSVRIVRFPGVPEKGDFRDWKAAGGTQEQFDQLVADAKPFEIKAAVLEPQEMNFDDEAKFIVRDQSLDGVSRLRFWHGDWYYWVDGRYERFEPIRVEKIVRKHLLKRFTRISSKLVSNVLDALRVDVLVEVKNSPVWIEKQPAGWSPQHLLATRDRIANLREIADGNLDATIPATPAYLNFVATQVQYVDEWEDPPELMKFLDSIWPDDPESIRALRMWMGYCLTPDTSYHKMLCMLGPTRSGKSTLTRVLTELVGGTDHVATPSLSSFAQPFGLSGLVGKQLAVITDARLSGRTDTSMVLERLLNISGEDAVAVDRKFRETMSIRLPTRLMIAANELPRFLDSSGALTKRVIVLQMTKSFAKNPDTKLFGKLRSELPQILKWAIHGYVDLCQNGGFIQPESAAGQLADLEDLTSPVSVFVRECCELDEEHMASKESIYTAYRAWSSHQGKSRTEDKPVFFRNLFAAFPTVTSHRPRAESGRVQMCKGLAVTHPPEPVGGQGWSGFRSGYGQGESNDASF